MNTYRAASDRRLPKLLAELGAIGLFVHDSSHTTRNVTFELEQAWHDIDLNGEVMDVAHRLGLSSTATMMFGHVETLEDRIEHLERVRAQQDKSKGFTAFIAWTFQAEHTKLKAPTVGAHEYLRTQALARIYLDNFANVQSSWVTQGLEIGQIALKYGANDLGSIMIEENVVSQAGTTFRMTVPDMQRLIKDLGYEPHQRDNWYHLLN